MDFGLGVESQAIRPDQKLMDEEISIYDCDESVQSDLDWEMSKNRDWFMQ